MFDVRVKRHGEWITVGRYATKKQAAYIAQDYRDRGEKARVVRER